MFVMQTRFLALINLSTASYQLIPVTETEDAFKVN